MRIVWVSHTAESVAGAELAMLESVVCLTARGTEVVAVVPHAGSLGARLEESGALVVEQPGAWWVSSDELSRTQLGRRAITAGVRNLIDLVPMSRLLRSLRPDVVVTNTIAIPLGALGAKVAGLPHVWYRHEFGRLDHAFIFHLGETAAFAAVDRLSDRVIANSQAVRGDPASARLRGKTRIVAHAVLMPENVTGDPPRRPGPLRLIQIGRIAPSKGHEDAIRAAGTLRRRGVDVNLRFVGSMEWPRYRDELLALAETEGVTDLVSLAGFRPDPTAEVVQADVALTCSRLEAFGRTTVEAMKLGRPVIGARSGGTAELIREGSNGFTYEPWNADDLAEKIERFHLDSSLIRTLGAQAKSWATETFTAERHASELIGVFEEVLAARAGSDTREAVRPPRER